MWLYLSYFFIPVFNGLTLDRLHLPILFSSLSHSAKFVCTSNYVARTPSSLHVTGSCATNQLMAPDSGACCSSRRFISCLLRISANVCSGADIILDALPCLMLDGVTAPYSLWWFSVSIRVWCSVTYCSSNAGINNIKTPYMALTFNSCVNIWNLIKASLEILRLTVIETL